MDRDVVRGTMLPGDVVEVPDELWRNLRRLAVGARLCLDRHSERMKIDSDYWEAVEHLTKLLSALPGGWGKTAQIVAAGHTLLIKVL